MKSSTHLANFQKGMTSIGWLLAIGIIGFFALLTMQLLPVYLGNMEVTTALEAIAEDPEIYDWNTREIRGSMSKRLSVGTWSRTVNPKDLMVIKHKDGTRTLNLKYQAKENFSGNIFIVVEFDETVDIPRER